MIDIAIDRKKTVFFVMLFLLVISLAACGKKKNIIAMNLYTLELPENWSYEEIDGGRVVYCMDETGNPVFEINRHEITIDYDGDLEGLVGVYGMHCFLAGNEQIVKEENYTIEKLKIRVEPSPPESAAGKKEYEEWHFWLLTEKGIELNVCGMAEEDLDQIEEILKGIIFTPEYE